MNGKSKDYGVKINIGNKKVMWMSKEEGPLNISLKGEELKQ